MNLSFASSLFQFSIIDVLNLVIAIVTLYLAFRIARNFDVKKAHINKQLETVFQLVEEINKCRIAVHYKTKVPQEFLAQNPHIPSDKAAVSIYHHTLWAFAEATDTEQPFEDVFLKASLLDTFPFVNYMNNALLPKSIAQKLAKFHSPIMDYSNLERASRKFVVLCPEKFSDPSRIYQSPMNEAFASFGNFTKACKELKAEILAWLKRYGADDINLNYTR